MPAPWSITNTSSSSAAATAILSQPTNAVAQGQQIRVRALYGSLAGTGAGTDTLQVKDGATVVRAVQLSIAANGFAAFALSGLDIRIAGTLTVAFASGVTNGVETVNAEGDFVQAGLGYGVNPA